MYDKAYFLGIVFLMTIFVFASAMEKPDDILGRRLYCLPCAQVLQEQLEKNYFKHFSDNTSLVAHLADKKLSIKAIMSIVRFEINHYNLYMNNPKVEFLINKRKLDLYKVLLHDSHALKEVAEELERYEQDESCSD